MAYPVYWSGCQQDILSLSRFFPFFTYSPDSVSSAPWFLVTIPKCAGSLRLPANWVQRNSSRVNSDSQAHRRTIVILRLRPSGRARKSETRSQFQNRITERQLPCPSSEEYIAKSDVTREISFSAYSVLPLIPCCVSYLVFSAAVYGSING